MLEESFSQVEYLLPFDFFPPEVGPGACASFVWGESCAEFFVLFCFSSDGQG